MQYFSCKYVDYYKKILFPPGIAMQKAGTETNQYRLPEILSGNQIRDKNNIGLSRCLIHRDLCINAE
jgi:hypothetical protein